MNNTTHTEEQMIEFYKNVPDDIREVLLDDNFGPAIQVIGRENGLKPQQSLEAENIVTNIMLGVEPLNQFNQLLQEKLEIPREKIREITKSIGENIFSQIKESLEKIQTPKEKIGEETIPKDTFIPIKIPIISPLPTAPTFEATPPLASSVSPKPIIGAEKIGIGIPKKESVEEHPFEKKLRGVTQPPRTGTLASIENEEVHEDLLSTDVKDSILPETPTQQEVLEKKTDPYREMAE